MWGRTFIEASIADIGIAINGDVILAGSFLKPTSSLNEAFVSRFRPDGVFVASSGLRAPPSEMLVDAGGSIILRLGGSANNVVALDDSLRELWATGTSWDTTLALTDYALVGARIDMSTGKLDLSRIEADDVETTVSLGTLISGTERGSGFLHGAARAGGGFAFGGEHNGVFDFGTGPIHGDGEMLIVVVDPMSEPVLTAN